MAADDRRELDLFAAEHDLDFWGDEFGHGEQRSLVELVNRVLDKGVCITGDVVISVAGVDLVYLGLNAVLTSVSTARARLDPIAGPRRAGGGAVPDLSDGGGAAAG